MQCILINKAGGGGNGSGNSILLNNLTIAAETFEQMSQDSIVDVELELYDLGYTYRGKYSNENVRAVMYPEATFSLKSIDDAEVDVANLLQCGDGYLYIYTNELPKSDITILTLELKWDKDLEEVNFPNIIKAEDIEEIFGITAAEIRAIVDTTNETIDNLETQIDSKIKDSIDNNDKISEIETAVSQKQSQIHTKAITLLGGSDNWVLDEENSYYKQILSNDDNLITATTQIDLLPDIKVINTMVNEKVTGLYIENNNGVASAIALNSAPASDYVIQANFIELGYVV